MFWVYASSITRVEEGLRGIAEKTQAPGWDEAKADTLGLVSHWLATHGPWVLIIDNADMMDVVCGPWRSQHNQAGHENRSLFDNLPMTANGSVLITSRSRDVAFRLSGDSGHIIQVGSMGLNQAGSLLRKTLTVSASVEDLKTLVQSLDGIPLALTQAAAFINQHYPRMTVSQYLEVLQREQTRLLQRDLGDSERDRDSLNSIIMTLIVSFEHIRQVHPSAARLLAFMSCFDHEAIPVDLLDSYHKDIKIDDFEFDFDLQDDVNVLQAYSLVWVNPTNTFTMHRMVQLLVKKWLEWHDELEGWRERYVKQMAKASPDGRYKNWMQCQILFPHAEAMLSYRVERSSFLEPWATVLFCASWYAKEQGWFDKAQEMAEASLQARVRILGEDHPDTLSSMTNLASTYQEQGRLAEAEELLIQVLKTEKQELGEEHPDTLASMNNLAEALSNQGKYEEAEAILRRTLMLREKVLGKDHSETLSSTIGLGEILRCRGDYIESENMLLYALTKQVQALSAESPDIQKGIDSLTSVFSHSSKTQLEFISDHKHRDKYNGMLQIAAVRGSQELVRQLVQKRIQVDFADVTHKKAFETAVNRGHSTVVRLLLEDYAESESEDAMGNALHAASAAGHEAVVQLLLDNGPGASRYYNALPAASAAGYKAVVRLLLDNGADVNAGASRYVNALQAASAAGHEAVVRLLLDNGADVNAGASCYGNALQVASDAGHEAVVRLLLDNGANVNAEAGPYDNPLHRASAGGHKAVVQLLLDNGAISGEILKLLTFEVLLDPDMKDLCEKMLKIKGESLFIRLFKREIRSFCSVLYTENLTEIQKGSIRILRRHRAYFAFRVCYLLKPSIRKGAVETASQDSRSAEDLVDDESSASNSCDDELDITPQSLTKDTSWLTRGASFRNFKHTITKQICSPLQYVHRVLQPALSAS